MRLPNSATYADPHVYKLLVAYDRKYINLL